MNDLYHSLFWTFSGSKINGRSLFPSSINCETCCEMASHTEAPGFKSFATLAVAVCLTTLRILGNWNGDLAARTSLRWGITPCAS